jgi:hypothetical protein
MTASHTCWASTLGRTCLRGNVPGYGSLRQGRCSHMLCGKYRIASFSEEAKPCDTC